MKFFLFLLLLLVFKSYAQDSDLSYLETQNTLGTPFSLPVRVNDKGQFSFFDTHNLASLGPTMQFSTNKEKVQYILPIRQNNFGLMEQEKDLGWFVVRRLRIEYGLGLEALIGYNVFQLGVTPYKGSYQVSMREKKSKDDDKENLHLPKELSELNNWGVGDQGSFQTYGGVQAAASVGFTYFTILKYTYVFQNQFIVGIRKVNENQMILSIGEESLKRRKIISGATIANAAASFNNGSLFTTQFILDINNPEHQVLYKTALKGQLIELQKVLPSTSQKIQWIGKEASYYVGIPFVVGLGVRNGHYSINDNGTPEELDINIRKNNGLFIPMRNHKRLVYQSDKNLILFWTSEMKRTHYRAVEKNFLSKGRIIGLKGFDVDIPTDTKFGSTITHLGIALTRAEVESMVNLDIHEFSIHIRSKCQEESLACEDLGVMNRNVKKMVVALKKPWKEMRHDLGKLLIKQPELIYALVKTMKLEKKVYFKFLSEKFQSIEGTAPIVL